MTYTYIPDPRPSVLFRVRYTDREGTVSQPTFADAVTVAQWLAKVRGVDVLGVTLAD